MIKYPLYFTGSIRANQGISTEFEASAEEFPSISCSIPKAFGGPGTAYSPEDLYLISILACFIATFKVFAEKAALQYINIEGNCKLTIDRNQQGMTELQKLDLTFTLKGVLDQKKAKTILAETEKFCLVSNAMKSEKHFTYIFSA